MKHIFLFTLFIATYNFCHAQNILISFAGTGASTTIDSVKVENLPQCPVLNIGGSDTLDLGTGAGINEADLNSSDKISTYPNPATEYCYAEFETNEKDNVTVSVSDMAGKKIFQMKEILNSGHHVLKISGLSKGLFILKIESEKYGINSKIVSLTESSGNVEISHTETVPGEMMGSNKERILTVMPYNTGDLLKLTGRSGNYRTVFMLTPASSQTVTFTFMACTDDDGNNYSVVKIGNQWWMAENLNSGTFATITTPQVSGTKFCMDVNGQEDPNCPMGGLYEWANLMQGASPCNGSGAPPNDDCANPVQGLCPNGWHIPSHYEWTTLERNSGSNPGAFPYNTTTISILGTDEGGNLKMACTDYWWDPNAGATNLTGFSGLPGGDTWNGVFEDFGQSAYFWTSSQTLFMSWVHALNYSLSTVGRSAYAVESGFSCRCVKD